MPDVTFSANNNQLITEIRVLDNDSSFRYLYLYDNLGNKVLETKFYQQDSTWIRQSLNEWIYDGNNCTTQRESSWKNNGWIITYSIDYGYSNGQLNSEIHNTYTNGIETLYKKIDSQYNSATLSSRKEYAWQSNAWTLTLETDFSYLPNGITDSIAITNFQSDSILSQQLSTFSYDTNGSLLSQLLQEKNGNVWINSELINWFYEPNTSLIKSVRNKIWLSDTSTWENTQMIDYEYTDNLQLLSETYQRWNAMFWENDIRYDYQYDSNNLLLKKTLSTPIYNDWRGLLSINYSNFTMNKANDVNSTFEFWGGNTGELTTSYIPFMFNDEPSIQKGESIHISYLPVDDTGLFTPVDNNTLKYIPVYPNPSDGIFYINTQNYNIKSWTVSDLNGKVLKNQIQSFQSGAIDITDYPKGIYILRVTTPDQQMIQKLIKQ
jgi:hypothetical protein